MKTDTNPQHYLPMLEEAFESSQNAVRHKGFASLDLQRWSVRELHINRVDWDLGVPIRNYLDACSYRYTSHRWYLKVVLVRAFLKKDVLIGATDGLTQREIDAQIVMLPIVALGLWDALPLVSNNDWDVVYSTGLIINTTLLCLEDEEDTK